MSEIFEHLVSQFAVHGLPYELSMKIAHFIPFEQLAELGVSWRELLIIGLRNPPISGQQVAIVPSPSEMQLLMTADRPTTTDSTPWFCTHINVFKWHLQWNRDVLFETLLQPVSHFTNDHINLPFGFMLLVYNRSDLMQELYRDSPQFSMRLSKMIIGSAFKMKNRSQFMQVLVSNWIQYPDFPRPKPWKLKRLQRLVQI